MFEYGRALLQIINHFLESWLGRDAEPPTGCPTPEPEQQQDEPEQQHESPESPEPEDKPSNFWQNFVGRSRMENWTKELQRWLPEEEKEQRQEQDHDHGRDR